MSRPGGEHAGRTDTDPQGAEMFQYRLQELRRAELVEQAETYRLTRRLRTARRAANRSGENPQGRVSDPSERFARAA
ncbi:hypothetical protein GCM10010387_48390 [Streptomyces inusitatus]|uniref:Uncharacterized protein n=2 Tax=Streptomyces inusitatus TaxID=68221 RepID=A0A918QIQ0_9ACTN|nr:hypothetical protein GCM10010387_48390 [Streptomyces inusitatus]